MLGFLVKWLGFTGLLLFASAIYLLFSWVNSITLRYTISLSVIDHGIERSGSTVAEGTWAYHFTLWREGWWMTDFHGQGIAIPLSSGKVLVVAMPRDATRAFSTDLPSLPIQAVAADFAFRHSHNIKSVDHGYLRAFREFSRTWSLPLENLPLLLAVDADTTDNIKRVKPNTLSKDLDDDVRIGSLIIRPSSDRVGSNIQSALPWVSTLPLSGVRVEDNPKSGGPFTLYGRNLAVVDGRL